MITLVTKGEERILNNSGNKKWLVNSILDIEFNEKENIAIIKWGNISLQNIILQTNYKSNIRDQALIDKLKEKTRLENDYYIIVDIRALMLQTNSFRIKKHITSAKYFKSINIEINKTKSEYKEEIEEINKLPK